MAFTVVDPNAPQSDANAYIDVATFNTFHTDRNVQQVVNSDFDPTQIQGAIVQATDYIDKRWGRSFRGFKRTRAQRLEWPRIDAFDNDNYLLDRIPDQLVAATAEFALLALQLGRNLAPAVAPGFAYLDANGQVVANGSGQVIATRDKAGPLESEVRYGDATSIAGFMAKVPEYPQAESWLLELTTSKRRLRRG